MSRPRIIWVQDEYDGPVNGLAEYNGEQLWFVRQSNPPMISSTEIQLPEQEHDYANRLYTLFRLTPNNLELVVNNHVEYCKETGAALNHGDAIKARRVLNVKRPLAPELKGDVKMTAKGLDDVKMFTHQLVPSEITGEVITTVKESEFVNYYVPRTLEI